MSAALERLCKWRSLLTGWQLGTRSNDDPEAQAVRDHREVTLLLRAEVNALVQIMVKKGVCSEQEFSAKLDIEAEYLQDALEKKFPGVRAVETGLVFDERAVPWMSKWKP